MAQPFSFQPFPQCRRDTVGVPKKEQRLDSYDRPQIPATDPPRSGQLLLSEVPREIKAQRMQKIYIKANTRKPIEKQKRVN